MFGAESLEFKTQDCRHLPNLGDKWPVKGAFRGLTVNTAISGTLPYGPCVPLLSSPSNPSVHPSSTIPMDSDYLPPPPAYSEQEFDQKISQATTLSLHPSTIDSDGWPQYDPAAFELTERSTSPTTAQRSSPMEMSSGKKDDYIQHHRISDSSSVAPLRIEKKSHQKSLPKPPTISRPWEESSSSTMNQNSALAAPHSETNFNDFRSQSVPLTTVPSVQQSAQDINFPSTPPPPPFEAQPPTSLPESMLLDNPYEQQYVNPYEQQYVNPYDQQYPNPYDQRYVNPYDIARSESPGQLSTSQPRPRFVPQERPMSSCSSSTNNFQPSYIPRLDFNPSIAYGRTQPVAPSLPIPLKQPVKGVQYDPHSFYNSAVSAHITAKTTGQHGHSSYSSYDSRNSFNPQKQYQQPASPTTSSRSGHSRQPGSAVRPASDYSMSSNYQPFNTSPSPVYQYVGRTANVPGNIYYDQQSPENRWPTR